MAATSTTSSLSARWAALSCSALFCAAAFGGGPVFETEVVDHPGEMPPANADFGRATGLSGALAIVGAPGSNGAFIYKRQGGPWVLVAELGGGGQYGRSVDIETPYAIVGQPGADTTGAARIYEDKFGEGWVERDVLQGSGIVTGDEFGFASAMSGNVVAVGAPGTAGGGRVYIFRRDGLEWFEVASLQGSDTLPNDRFGASVDIDGDTVIVGAPDADTNGAASGRVYIFERNTGEGIGEQWDEVMASTPAAYDSGDQIGTDVAISGGRAVSGAPAANFGPGGLTGTAHFFSNEGGSWAPTVEVLAASVGVGQGFGSSVDIDGAEAIIGANFAGGNQGRAFMFTDDGGSWLEMETLAASDAGSVDLFATSIALSGDTAICGAPLWEGPGGNSNVGRAYIFEGLFGGAECPGDINGDLFVDSTDLNAVLSAFGSGSGGDADGDGDTDSSDLNIVLANFGEDCFPDPQ